MLLLTKLIDFFNLFQTREKQARTKSAELLKKELEREENLGCTEYLTKVSSFVGFFLLVSFLVLMSTQSAGFLQISRVWGHRVSDMNND